jgi:single-strand DNA-binding protein
VLVTGRLKSRSYETKEGEKRTVVELEVDEVGPSLRYATAKVNRTQRSGGGGQGGGWSGGGQGGGQGGGGQGEDPWATGPSGGSGSGATAGSGPAPAGGGASGGSGSGWGGGGSSYDEPPF